MNKEQDTLKLFEGQRLEMICCNSTQLYFHFSSMLAICITDKYRVCVSGQSFTAFQVPIISSSITSLLDKCVQRAFLDSNGLEMNFGKDVVISVPRSDRFVEWLKILKDGESVFES